MPEQPPPKHDLPHKHVTRSATSPVPYAELHCRTNFSFLEGASHPHELVERAAELGYKALAITDRDSLAGVVRAHVTAKETGLKLLIGASITPIDAPPMLLWVMNRKGYANLSRLLTHGRRSAPKGECRLTFDDVERHCEGLLVGVRLEKGTQLFSRASTTNSYPPPGFAGGGQGGGLRLAGSGCALSTQRALTPHPALPPQSRGEGKTRTQKELRPLFDYALASLHRGPLDRQRLQQFQHLAREANLPLVAINDVYYHVPQRRPLHDVLVATRHGCTVAELGEHRLPNGERHLKSPEEMRDLFAAAPELIARTVEIADRCNFSLDELRYDYPEELCPPGYTPLQYLTELTWVGARRRYPTGIPDKVRGLIEHELQLIAELRYEAYFLTVWDIVRFARERQILCQGRGSAANSAVCYCLGVTSVDPERIDVLFERFVSKDRDEAPDIDVDFEHERREEVLQYLWDKYGRDRAAMTAEVITYRERSAIRDVGKALGLSLDRVDVLAKTMDHHPRRDEDRLAGRLREGGLDPNSRLTRQLVWLTHELLGFPRHLSQHVGGMVMTNGPLCELVPIENAAMPDRTVVQWDKNDLDALGILKVDCLCLGMLTAIRKCFDLIAKHHGKALELATVPAEDPVVYEMIGRSDTIGVFQIESRAQMSMLPRLRPKEFYDLVIEVAIVRPGPIQGKMVHPYLRRRQGKETVEYPSEAVRSVLEKTLGVPIFQEQAMRLAVVAAGFTPGEADQLRRAMGAWRKTGVMERFRDKLINGMLERGYTPDFAQRVYQQICGFGEYGFPESHAASFALLVYVSAWLKCYYPAAFAAGIINSLPMGFYAPAQLIADAKKHGVEVLPVDVNLSDWDCTLEAIHSRSQAPLGNAGLGSSASLACPASDRPSKQSFSHLRSQAELGNEDIGLLHYDEIQVSGEPGRVSAGSARANSKLIDRASAPGADATGLAINEPSSDSLQPLFALRSASRLNLRLGFRLITGLAQRFVDPIIAARRDGPFTTFTEFVRRTGLRAAALKRLSAADAFGSLQMDRQSTLWRALPERGSPTLFDQVDQEEAPSPSPLPPLTPFEEVMADYRTAGLTLRQHPMSFFREQMNALKITPAAKLSELKNDIRLKVAGIVLLRQRPSTAKGITFVTLEDETGMVNLIVRMEVWERYRKVARTAVAMIAHGRLQIDKESLVIHVLVTKMEDLTHKLTDLTTHPRNFH